MNTKSIAACTSVVACTVILWWSWPATAETRTPNPPSAENAPPAQPEPELRHADTAVTTVTTAEPAGTAQLIRSSKPFANAMVYPDGLMLPALNKVTGHVEISWPPGIPYTPVIAMETMPNGTEWYHHEGDIWTTTYNTVFTQNGRRYSSNVGKVVQKRPDTALSRKN